MNLRKMLYFKKANTHSSSNDSVVVGKCFMKSLTSELSSFVGTSKVLCFLRAKIGSTVYHSKEHERKDAARVSLVVSFYEDGVLCFGSILFFASVEGEPKVLLDKYTMDNGGVLSGIGRPTIQALQSTSAAILDSVIFKVKKLSLSKELAMVSTEKIFCKCILIPVKGHEYDYIILQPNQLEKH